MKKINLILITFLLIIVCFFIGFVVIKSINKKNIHYPYYVATKIDKTNIRSGPDKEYPVLLSYNTSHIPLKVLDKYNNWLQVENYNGIVGWVLQSLVNNKAYAINMQNVSVYNNLQQEKIIGIIKNNNTLKVISCTNNLCKVEYAKDNIKLHGWVEKNLLWGNINN